MTTILIEKDAFYRLQNQLSELSAELDFILMEPDGSLTHNEQPTQIETAQPDVAWFSIDLAYKKLFKQFGETVLAAESIKWLQTFNAGLNHPMYQQMLDQGMRISGSSAQAIAIAEYIIANVLVCYQGVFERKRYQDAHQWQKTNFKELWRTKWVIVGFGNIGRELAKRLRSFECEIIAVRKSGRADVLADQVLTLDQINEHLPHADGVVIACPLTAETEGLVDQAFLAQMKPGATFVNVGRGKIVDQPALIAALNSGTIGHAILDVFDPEPLPADSPLWDIENVLISPHSSNAGNNTALRGDMLFLDNLKRYLADEPLLNEASK